MLGDDFFSGERSKGKGPDKLLGGAGHDDLHADTAILQLADNFSGFVGCDSAGDAEGDFHGIFDCRFSTADFRTSTFAATANRKIL